MAPMTVVVTGATGNQGGGVVAALLAQQFTKIRAITRNASSNSAQSLAAKGVEIAQADMDDKASLQQAFKGADQLFLVTDFFGGARQDAQVELQQGKNAIDAAKEAGVGFVVFSTVDHIPQDVQQGLPAVTSDGMIIPHYESKAAIEDYLRQSGLAFALLRTSMFYENVINFAAYQRSEDGCFSFADNLGTDAHAWHAVGDIGQSAAVLFAAPTKYQGQTIPVASDKISQPDVAAILSEVTGKTVKYHAMTDEQYASLPFPAAEELANMYHYYRSWPYYDAQRPLDKAVYKGPSFKDWASQHSAEITKKLEASG